MRPYIISAIVLAAIAVLVGAWYATHEEVERERYVGFRGEARINDYFAAELLIRELGFEAESRPTLTPSEWMPDPTDTMILQLSEAISIGDERNAVLDWVHAGGHMILLPPGDSSDTIDSFLAEFSLELIELYYSDDDEPTEVAEDDTEYANEYAIEPVWGMQDIAWTGNADVIRNDNLVFAARRTFGDGYVTLLTESTPFTNQYLEEGDNARLFADIVVGELESGKVWITFEATFSPLWQIIWRSAPFVVATSALFLLLWIWHAMPAFGPKQVVESASRRSIIEHIRASGIFTWRKHGGAHLMESSTQALVHEAAAKHPGLSKRSTEEQARVIAKITGMSAQKVMDALHGHPDPKHREFTNSMQKLQSIRKEL